jgi:hypothetical protein
MGLELVTQFLDLVMDLRFQCGNGGLGEVAIEGSTAYAV